MSIALRSVSFIVVAAVNGIFRIAPTRMLTGLAAAAAGIYYVYAAPTTAAYLGLPQIMEGLFPCPAGARGGVGLEGVAVTNATVVAGASSVEASRPPVTVTASPIQKSP